MSKSLFFQPLQIGAFATTPLELFGVITGLLCVYLTVRQNIWCWPIGIIAAIASGVLFFDSKLYADMWLQGFFVATSGYGWHWWLRGGPRHSILPVSTLDNRQRALLGAATLIAVVSVGGLHARFTDASLPFLDAAASGASVTAQLIMMRKKIECWPLWIAIDTVSIGIYVYKELYAYAIQYAIFLVLAALGWLQWKQSLNQTLPNSKPLPHPL